MINSCLAWSAYQADSWCLVNGTQWHRQSKHRRSGPQHPCTVSAQKNITVKADTHSNIYSHIKTELNNSKIENSPSLEYLYSIVLFTGSQKVISTASTDHWRSGLRHHSPLYGVCAEDHYCKSMHTLSHLFSHSNGINNSKIENSPNSEYKYLRVLSKGSKKSSVWPPQSRVCSAVAPHQQFTPDTFWARQCWKKWKHEMGTCLILSVITNYRLKNQLVNKSNQLISMITKSSYLLK